MRGDPGLRTDDVFLADLAASYDAVAWVAACLIRAGLPVSVPPARVRPSYAERAAYNDGGVDLWIGLPDDGWRIQVKRRNCEFSTVEDFPHPDIFVDTEPTIRKMTIYPDAYILTSQSCSSAIVIPWNSKEHWIWREKDDPTRGYVRTFAVCPKAYAFEFNDIINRLRQHYEREGHTR